MAEPSVTQAEIEDFLRSNFGAAFNTQFSPFLTKNNPFASWLGNRQGTYFDRYTGQVAGNPNLDFITFLKSLNPQAEFGALTPGQRGEQPGKWAPSLKWLGTFGGR